MTPAAGEYRGDGWCHWPGYPQPSALLTRVLGGVSLGAGSIGECLRTASRIDPADPASWHAEWQALAERVHTDAHRVQQAGHRATARAMFLRAAAYFRAAEFLLPPGAAAREAAFAAGVKCTRAWAELSGGTVAPVEIPLPDGGWLAAYFALPPGGAPSPAVIVFGGLDACKEEMLPRVWRHATDRGMAVLVVDLPGQGETRRRAGLPLRCDVEVPVAACCDWLERQGSVDATRIGLCGSSLGGVLAARAAAHERRLAGVVSDSCIFDLAAHLESHLAATGGQGWELLEWVFGCSSPRDVIEKSRALGMAAVLGEIRVPYLIVQGEHDFLGVDTARKAFEFAAASGVAAEWKLLTQADTGAAHCHSDNPVVGLEFVWDWLRGRLA
ncbi:MAG: alpha/beta hydrolase [Burkholderiales bacterium]|nr:alpha/beta hydrolase [Burkholderiales bacterium]